MSNTVKVLLALVGAVVLLCVVGVLVSVFWFKQHQRELVGSAQDGARFGTNQPGTVCETEALRRGDACTGLVCEVDVRLFLTSCLGASQPTPGFCDGVPTQSHIRESADWAVGRCSATGRVNDQRCSRIEGGIQAYCHPAGH